MYGYMSFSEMGQADRSVESQKGTIMGSDIKGVTVRLSDEWLSLLNQVAPKLGVSRQAFMSKVIEQYSTQAFVDYLIAYDGWSNAKSSELFDKSDNGLLNDFCFEIDELINFERLYHKAMNSLDKDDEIRKEYDKANFNKFLKENPHVKKQLIESGELEADE